MSSQNSSLCSFLWRNQKNIASMQHAHVKQCQAMSTCQLPEFGTFRCSGSSVHSRFLGPGVIPKTLWNIMKLCVTVTLGIMAASWLHQIQPTIPRRKNTTTVLRGCCCLRFVLKPVFSQATRVDIEDEQIHPAASRLRTSIKSKIDFQHFSTCILV